MLFATIALGNAKSATMTFQKGNGNAIFASNRLDLNVTLTYTIRT